jgi:HD-like signal output (HDOD) protein
MSIPVSAKANDLRKLLTGAQLPALPQSAIKLLELAQNPDNGPPEFAKPIEADPGLTGQVLRFVNSSYFGFAREISSVKLAISLVGIRTIKNFSLWSAVFSLVPNPKCGPFDLKSLWQDSLRRALFARRFGKSLGLKETEEAFAGALLQDMAVPLLAKELPLDYAALLTAREGGKRRLSELEQERFGWTHAQAAAEMARSWNLPREFADLVERHTIFDQNTVEQGLPPLQAAVTLSSLLPASSDPTWTEAANFDDAFHHWCPSNPQPIMELLAEVDQEFTEFAPVLKLATPAKSLRHSYQEVTAAV